MAKIPLISIIVPVYNVSNYIRRCLHSVIAQTYANLEIILIDDGSTDGSGKIIDDYSVQDERIKIIHQSNAGLSSARNKGIEVATGEYLSFVDSDDFVAKDYVEYLYRLLKNDDFNSPLAICSLMDVYSTNGKQVNQGDGSEQVLSGEKCIEKMCYHDLVDTCAYAKLGRKELYDHVRFPVGSLFEDIATTYLLFDQCQTVACGFKPKYFYVLREDSITTSSFNAGKLDLLKMTDQMAGYVNANYPQLQKATLRRQTYARFSTLNQMLGTKAAVAEKKQIIKFLKEHENEVLSDPRTPRRDKIAYHMLNLGYPIYSKVWQLYEFAKKSKLFRKKR